MQNDIQVEMKARYAKMLAEDVNKQKVEKAKVEMLESGMDEEGME